MFSKIDFISNSIFRIYLLVFFLVIGIILRFYNLDHVLGTGYKGFDEGLILRFYAYSPLEVIATTYFGEFSHHVFHTIILHFMVMGFGEDNELAIRFPVFVFAIFCLWMIFKVAFQLTGSNKIAIVSLIIATFLPIHIFWSQTARGYSLIMFFSIFQVYLTIRLLESAKNLKLASLFITCGVLSIYTIPTNTYFLFGLGVWLLGVLFIPIFTSEFSFSGNLKKKKVWVLLLSFITILVISFLLYLPLLESLFEVAEKEQRFINDAFYGPTKISLIKGLVLDFITKLFFKGSLILFLPFLFIGVIWGTILRRSYKWLVVMVFILPFLVTSVTGIAGYPRNYLYNLPLFVIFLAIGIVKSGDWLAHLLSSQRFNFFFVNGVLAAFILLSLKILFTEYYPSLGSLEKHNYKEALGKLINPNDLLVLPDVNNHLYVREYIRKNLLNILLQNKLSDVKVIASKSFIKKGVSSNVGTENEYFLDVFKNNFPIKDLEVHPVAREVSLIKLSGEESFSLLPEDFESSGDWKVRSGVGEANKEKNEKYSGDYSLKVISGDFQDLIIETSLPWQFELLKDNFVVAAWMAKNLDKYYDTKPLLAPVFALQEFGQTSFSQIPMEKVNRGLDFFEKDKSPGFLKSNWVMAASLGLAPPGKYAGKILIMVPKGHSVVFDNLRLFFIEIEDKG